jgi:hypothetical protein
MNYITWQYLALRRTGGKKEGGNKKTWQEPGKNIFLT